MNTRIGRAAALGLACIVVPAFATAQSVGGAGSAGTGTGGAVGGSPSLQPGGVGPSGTAWSGSMPQGNVNTSPARGGGPRSNRSLGLDPTPASGTTQAGNPSTLPSNNSPGSVGDIGGSR